MDEVTEDWQAKEAFLRNIFQPRKSYANKWESSSGFRFYLTGRRLVVNGYAIEVCTVNKNVTELITTYHSQTLTGIAFKAIDNDSLEILKQNCCKTEGDLYIPANFSGEFVKLNHQSLQRILPYETDPIKVVFNESIDVKGGKFLLQQIAQDFKTGKRGIGSRSNKTDISSLLTARGIDITRYSKLMYTGNLQTERIYIYVKCFAGDLREPLGKKDINLSTEQGDKKTSVPISNMIQGSKGLRGQNFNHDNLPYKYIYIRATVDRLAWLLFEPYLSDFAKVELSENEGYINKVYISAKKFIVPAKINIEIDNNSSISIPFGPKDGMKYEEAIQLIRERLQNSGIANLKTTFTRESIKT